MNQHLTDSLNLAFSNTFELYTRAHGMHWNIEGMFFPLYHDFFSAVYSEIYGAIDIFAEEIRAAGGYVGYGTHQFAKNNMLPETKQIVGTDVKGMLEELSMSNAIVIKSLNAAFKLAERENLQGLMDFLAARIDAHAKHAWMIGSCLKSA